MAPLRPSMPSGRGRLRVLAWLGLCMSAPQAPALVRGTSAAGVAYASGGGSYEELELMRAEQQRFSFWLTTAVRGSGAYLADVKVRITDEAGKRVLDHTMDGPWLFVDLPPGRYQVESFVLDEASGRLEVQRGSVAIRSGDRQRMVLYFSPVGEGAGERGAGHDGRP